MRILLASAAVALCAALSQITNAASTITSELVAHLPFDNDFANAASSPVTASPVGSVMFDSGRMGSAMVFTTAEDGSSVSYVTLGTPAELNFGGSTDFTVSFWVKLPPNSWRNDPAFVSNKDWRSGGNPGWVIAATSGGGFQWNYTESTKPRYDYDGPSGTINDGNWHHIAVSFYRSGSAISYLDGRQVDSQVIAPPAETVDAGLPTNIGQDGTGTYTDGGSVGITNAAVDDVAIWRRALAGAELARIYQFGIQGINVSAIPDAGALVVENITPTNGATSVSLDTAIRATIVDGSLPLAEGTVQLLVNGTPVVPSLNKSGPVTRLSYQPALPLVANTTNTVTLVYGDGTSLFTNEWQFVTAGAIQGTGITGQWDFESGDLSATLGAPLEYYDGANGATAQGTQFGTTRSFGIPDINGVPAKVMRFPGATTTTIGYVMRHGALPNGGAAGTKVNQWTIIMDILIPRTESQRWFSFMQIDNLGNSNDGDLFVDFNSGGIGISGSYQGSIIPGQWHRVAFAVDSENVIGKYIDGVQVAGQTSWSGKGLNGRHALLPTTLLFADEDGESQVAYVNSIQIRNQTLSDRAIMRLGGPSASGIPLVTGQWDFDDGTVSATLGSDLIIRDDPFYTQFETAGIDGQEARVMRFSGLTSTDGYIMPHGALPNGGGNNVNQYTLIMDLSYPQASADSWRALFQTDTNNATDGDLFVNPGDGIGISSQYQGTIQPDVWHRVVFTFDLTKRELGKYIDGRNVLTGPVGSSPLGTGPFQYLSASSGGVDQRWSLGPLALLFADEDGELAEGLVNSIQFRAGVLTAQEVAALGVATANGIPGNIPSPPALTFALDFGALIISWPMDVAGFTLESTPVLGPGASWSPVEGVVDNSVTLEIGSGTGFFRLRR